MGLGYATRFAAATTPTARVNSVSTVLARVSCLTVLLVAWGMRLVALTRQDIWWDEARNIDVALRPFLQVALAPELDIHPPVYFWLLHGWSRVHMVSMALEPAHLAYVTRLLSVAAGVVSVALLVQMARLLAPREQSAWAGVSAATIGACSPFWLAESQETRMYTLGFALLTAAAVALLFAWRGFSAHAPRARVRFALVWFVVLSALALLTHYNAVFIVAAWYLGWLVRAGFHADKRQMLVAWLLCGLSTALLVAPITPIALRQIPGYENPNLTVPSLADYLQQNWQAYWGGYAFAPAMAMGRAALWLWGAAAIALFGIGMAWAASKAKTPLLFVLWWLFGGLALYYVAVLDRGAFNVRYSSFVTPALYALLGAAVAAWSRWWRPLAAVALVMMVALWPKAIHADLFDDRNAREDIAGVTAWLREHAAADSVIFVDQKYPFGFYYDRYEIDAGAIPEGDEAAPARYLFVDINTIDAQLQEWAGNASEVYWVQWFESDTDPRRAVAFLLDQQGERGGEENFQGYSIDWWRMTPPNQFVLAPHLAPIHVRFPGAVRTVAASFPFAPVEAGGHVPVVIRWARDEDSDVVPPLKARVALYDAAGTRLAQRDERLLNDRHLLPAEWTRADQPLNVYLLDIPDDLQPGTYSIGLLVYDSDTLEAVEVVDSAGNPGEEAMIGSVEIVAKAQ